jgi:hypothetical protein
MVNPFDEAKAYPPRRDPRRPPDNLSDALGVSVSNCGVICHLSCYLSCCPSSAVSSRLPCFANKSKAASSTRTFKGILRSTLRCPNAVITSDRSRKPLCSLLISLFGLAMPATIKSFYLKLNIKHLCVCKFMVPLIVGI